MYSTVSTPEASPVPQNLSNPHITSLLGDIERLTLEENHDEDLVDPDSSGGHKRVETQQILPVDGWVPYAHVTTFESDLGEVDFSISADQELTAVICDDQWFHIFRKHFSIQPKQVLSLALMLYVSQQLDNKYLPLATLVDDLVELGLTRLRSRRLEKSDMDHPISGNEFFLTILRRVKDRDALIYRVVPMTVDDGEAFCENPTATVPGKIMKVEVCEGQTAKPSFTLWYLFRQDNLTWLAGEDLTNFGDLNEKVYFQVRQEGAENGYILNIPAEIKISPWGCEVGS
ncbi:hypothetical protein H2202_011116 [Exophiala xenobiotica]|nr:hypothetical protein H2202_011116 [Exophiala xenobiotica]KAK5215606.1 hypothetical protein LTR72_011348 [Exophiala xenobiotica]KAK5284743.1 hypothetical protein LTR14_011532 [Exophiala xenobiotica]KAK5312555.1 hypothetical protein LTR93_011291 [Exophiala xenobiotica]KAK5469100.1 hypothetical protein LTR55_011364 [Exophiala xenobiotica]